MKNIKFHLFIKKNGAYEEQCIGPSETVLKTLANCTNSNAIFKLFTINESGKELDCVETGKELMERFIKWRVIPIEKKLHEIELKNAKNLEKIVKNIF